MGPSGCRGTRSPSHRGQSRRREARACWDTGRGGIGGAYAVCVVVFITAMVAPTPDPPATVIWALASGVLPVVAAFSVWVPAAVPAGIVALITTPPPAPSGAVPIGCAVLLSNHSLTVPLPLDSVDASSQSLQGEQVMVSAGGPHLKMNSIQLRVPGRSRPPQRDSCS